MTTTVASLLLRTDHLVAQGTSRRLLPQAGYKVEDSLEPGQRHQYELAVDAGRFVDLVVTDEMDAVAVVVADHSGSERLRLLSNAKSVGARRVCFVSERSESYIVTTELLAVEAQGERYTLEVADVRPADDTDRQRAAAFAEFLEGERLRAQRKAEGYRAAISHYQISADQWSRTGDPYEQAHSLHRLGQVYATISDYRKALQAFEQAAALRHQLGARKLEGGTLSNIGAVYDILGDYPTALRYYDQALSIRRETNDRYGQANTLSNIGSLYHTMGDVQKALEYYMPAIALWQAMHNVEGEAASRHGAGGAHLILGNFDEALTFLNEALRLRRSIGDRDGAGWTLTEIGNLRLSLGDTDKALEAYNEALPLIREAGDRRGEAVALDALGRALARRGEPESALERFSAATEISRAIGERNLEALALFHGGEVWLRQGDARRASALLEQARTIFRAIGNQGQGAYADVPLAEAEAALGEFDVAQRRYEDALTVARGLRNRDRETLALGGLARLEWRAGRLADARAHAEAAIDLTESLRTGVGNAGLRASYLAATQTAYETFIDIEMELEHREPGRGHAASALYASERKRARGLLDLLSESQVQISSGIDPQLADRERRLTFQLAAADGRLTQLLGRKAQPDVVDAAERAVQDLVEQLGEARRQLRLENPRYASLVQPAPLDAAGIQQLLDPGTTLIEYALGAERSYVWVVTRDHLNAATLPGREQITDLARRAYDLLAKSVGREGRMRTERMLSELSNAMLSPVADRLSADRLVIVADGALQYIPFGALPLHRGQGRAGDDEPLLALHEIVTLPSASVLGELRHAQHGKPEHRLAVLADPVLRADDPRVKGHSVATTDVARMGATAPVSASASSSEPGALTRSAGDTGLSLDRLPYTRAEAEAITALAGRTSTLEALDFDASRARAMTDLGQSRIVHFATHALLNSRRPELSGIVLSLVNPKGEPVDGFLRLHDIYNLSLHADLVVLSACQTALGRDIRGEGLVGLTRGFLYAGAPAVVASLWDVRDRSTAELMTRFYRGMLRDHLQPAAALRAAQLSMRREPRWTSPTYWAPFVLQGDWKSVEPPRDR